MWGSPHAGTGATECYPNSPATASAENALLQTHMGHGIWPVPKERAAPAYIKPSVCLDAASKTWVVVISGLDERMCKTEMIEAMLYQAQVAAYFQSCRVKKVCNACELKRDIAVAFSTREAAKRCVQHFNGRHGEFQVACSKHASKIPLHDSHKLIAWSVAAQGYLR